MGAWAVINVPQMGKITPMSFFESCRTLSGTSRKVIRAMKFDI